MKKILALSAALCLLLCAAAFAQEEAPFTFRGVTFGMSLDSVVAAETARYEEIDSERTRGGLRFTKLEYEHVTEHNARADLTYLFLDDALVAIRVSHETRDIRYDDLKALLTAAYGESAPLDAAALGNGIYAVDDDGRPEGRTECWTSGTVMIVLERDGDDLDVTYVDLSAAYVSAR